MSTGLIGTLGSGCSASVPSHTSRGRISTFAPSAAVGSSCSAVLMQSSSTSHNSFTVPLSSTGGSALNHQQREVIRQWIRKEGSSFWQIVSDVSLGLLEVPC